ncbi:HAD-IIIA family hydrolase [Sporosarcina aquimarina]|uniref:HAD-IIIA family hydrolase n=1 Tax=Sporosarcina aquimarina TaxID=114975 RepID=UPI0020418FE5|nr:HAD-IIIA family hydrolase [Sporosarcina aquimarina]MCM3758997.1 HAD-IIIA family hydrolase [Sporosarcina aquimarina]
MKVAFFDRDGTIIDDYPDHKWTSVKRPVFLDGAIRTLKEVLNKGYKIIIITNQYIINEGYITEEQYQDITKQMLIELKNNDISIHDIYYCPHAKTDGCYCIKPRTGMIRQALKVYPDIDLSKSFMVGDSAVDVELAINMKIKGFGIGIGSEYDDKKIIQIEKIKDLINYL